MPKKALMVIDSRFDIGIDIDEAFETAIKYAKENEVKVEFDFNGQICIAHPEGDVNLAIENYYAGHDVVHCMP